VHFAQQLRIDWLAHVFSSLWRRVSQLVENRTDDRAAFFNHPSLEEIMDSSFAFHSFSRKLLGK
jgi:hypothetical protein